MNKDELLARIQIAFVIKWCIILAVFVAVFCLLEAILDPFFVYYQIPKSVEFLVVACCIAMPWAWGIVLSNPNIRLFKRNQTSPDQTLEVVANPSRKKYWIALGCAVVGIYVLVHESNQFDSANQIAHYRDLALTAMENDCAQSCDDYGISQSDLIGPQLVHVGSFEPHSGKRDYLFSWHSRQPHVVLTEHLYNYDGQKWVDPEAIEAVWTGKPIPQQPVQDDTDDLAPHYTAVRDDFKQVIAAEMPEIKNAYMRAKLSNPDMSGDVKVHIIVDTYGQVAAASVVDSDLDNPDFEDNLVYLIKGLTFKSGQFATLDTVYTFSFD